jgi:hypothetical protein
LGKSGFLPNDNFNGSLFDELIKSLNFENINPYKYDMIHFISLLIVFCTCVYHDKTQDEKCQLTVNAILRGSYDLTQNGINELNPDSICYFLIEIKLVNNSKESSKFIFYDCTPISNIVLASKEFKICTNSCLSNARMLFELKPNEELSFPIIIKSKSKNAYDKIRIGWAFLTKENLGAIENFDNILEKAHTKYENVIWSNYLQLDRFGGKPLEIR